LNGIVDDVLTATMRRQISIAAESKPLTSQHEILHNIDYAYVIDNMSM